MNWQAELPPQGDLRNAGMGGFLPYKATATLLHSSMGGPPSLQVASPSWSCYILDLQMQHAVTGSCALILRLRQSKAAGLQQKAELANSIRSPGLWQAVCALRPCTALPSEVL